MEQREAAARRKHRGWRRARQDQDQGEREQHQQQHGQLQEVKVNSSVRQLQETFMYQKLLLWSIHIQTLYEASIWSNQKFINKIQHFFRSLPNICKEKPVIKHAWRASDEDEEKFQREILGEEPNLIKLYLQQRGDRNSWNGTGNSLSRGDTSETSEPADASYSEDVFTNKVSSCLQIRLKYPQSLKIFFRFLVTSSIIKLNVLQNYKLQLQITFLSCTRK